jgi:hypothetical protein
VEIHGVIVARNGANARGALVTEWRIGGEVRLIDLAGADGLDGVGDEVGDECQETGHVREMAVAVEGGFIGPFGMDAVEERIASGFVKMDVEAARLGAGGGHEGEEFIVELRGFAGGGLETDEDVKRHGKSILDEKRKGLDWRVQTRRKTETKGKRFNTKDTERGAQRAQRRKGQNKNQGI